MKVSLLFRGVCAKCGAPINEKRTIDMPAGWTGRPKDPHSYGMYMLCKACTPPK